MTDDRKIPRLKDNNYSEEAARARREFITRKTGAPLEHTAHYSLPPESLSGNTENFIGVVQVPVGVAGPYRINGDAAGQNMTGKAKKLAEIVAATVLAGDLSLAAAIVSDEWVSSHDRLGRNRP